MASIPDRKLPTPLYAQMKDLLFEHIQSGELGGDADAIPILLGLGVDELSMAPALILQAKAIIRTCDLSSARRLAKKRLS